MEINKDNATIIKGILTRDPELRYTPSGTAVTTFPLMTTANFKESKAFVEHVVWGEEAENVANVYRKGDVLGAIGRVSTRRFENRQGKYVYVQEVTVDKIFDGTKLKDQLVNKLYAKAEMGKFLNINEKNPDFVIAKGNIILPNGERSKAFMKFISFNKNINELKQLQEGDIFNIEGFLFNTPKNEEHGVEKSVDINIQKIV